MRNLNMLQRSLILLGLMLGCSQITAGEFNKTLKIGDSAPAWTNLPGVDDKKHSLSDLKDKDFVVVVFHCNSCPCANDYEERIIAFTSRYAGPQSKVAVVAINCNTIPDDRLPKMKERAGKQKYNFPYLYDESQKIAKAFGAEYTPEIFVLNRERKVVYMGAMDDRNNAADVKVLYLVPAIESLLKGETPAVQETQGRGCKIRFVRDRRE